MSTFSGCGGFELALEGHECVGFSEIDPYASAVYRYHFPHHPEYGDITEIDADALPAFDLLVGGFPCQDLSVAGKRAGLAGKRSGLFYDVIRILEAKHPAWFVLENVAGLLSSNGGRDMGTVLGALVDCGYGVAWRVLDSRFAGVPQRRRRIFLVGHLGDERAADVLALTEGVSWDSPSSGEARQTVAALTANGVGVSGADDNQAQAGHLIAVDFRHGELTGEIAHTLQAKNQGGHSLNYAPGVLALASGDVAHTVTAHYVKGGDPTTDNYVCVTGEATHALRAEGADASEDGTGRGTPIIAFSSKDSGADAGDTSPTLRAMNYADSHLNGGGQIAVALALHDAGLALRTNYCDCGTDYRSWNDKEPCPDCGGFSGSVTYDPPIGLSVAENQRAEVLLSETTGALKTGGGKPGQGYPAVMVQTARGNNDGAVTEDAPAVTKGYGDGNVSLVLPSVLEPAKPVGVTLHGAAGTTSTATITETASALRARPPGMIENSTTTAVFTPATVRRLTPKECERLMSWEDDHSRFGRKPDGTTVEMSDSRRYRMVGNGVVSAVVRQIVARIEAAA
jgi:DNA (cytosine-5)-methyltransferase 1